MGSGRAGRALDDREGAAPGADRSFPGAALYEIAAGALLSLVTILSMYKTVILGRPISQIGRLKQVDCFFNPSLTGHMIPVEHDPSGYSSYFPFGHFIEQALRAGHLSLWNPDSGFGFPLLGAIFVHPLSFLHCFGFFSSARGYDLLVVCKCVIAVLGAYLAARLLSLSRLSACFVGLAFAFCPRVLTNTILSTNECFFPLAAAGFIWLARKPTVLRACLTGLLCSFLVANMQPEECFFAVLYSAFLSVLLILSGAFQEGTPLPGRLCQASKVVSVAALVAFLAAAPLLLPFVELLRHAVLYKEAAVHGADRTLVFVAHYLHGLLAGPIPGSRWSDQSLLYTGVLTVALVPLAFMRRSRLAACLTLAWLVAAYVSCRPMWAMLSVKPFCNLSSGHGSAAAALFALLLAGYGLDSALSNSRPAPGRMLIWLAGTACMIVLGSVLVLSPGSAEPGILPLLRANRHLLLEVDGIALAGLATLFLFLRLPRHGALVAAVAVILLNGASLAPHARRCLPVSPPFDFSPPEAVAFLQRHKGRFAATGKNFFQPCVNLYYDLSDCRTWSALKPARYLRFCHQPGSSQAVSIASPPDRLLDLGSVRYFLARGGIDCQSASDQGAGTLPTRSAGRVRPGLRLLSADLRFDQLNSQVTGRISWRAHAHLFGRYALQFSVASKDRARRWTGREVVLSGPGLASHELVMPVVFPVPTTCKPGDTVLITFKVVDTWTGDTAVDGSKLDVSGDQVVLASFVLPDKSQPASREEGRLRLVYETKDMLRIYESRSALPNAYVVHEARFVGSSGEALAAVEQASFDPSRSVVLEGDGSFSPRGTQQAFQDTVRLARPDPDRVVVDTRTGAEGFLVLTDTFYPGWKARVGSREVPVLAANCLFRAIRLPAGEHRVVFSYQPDSFRIGLALACVGVILSLGAALQEMRRRRA